MNKLISCILMAITLHTILFSQQITMPIESGYLDNGIRYEIYMNTDSELFLQISDNSISIRIEFDGIVSPPKTYNYTENINGIIYRGTLKLASVKYQNTKTIAIYTGTVHPNNT